MKNMPINYLEFKASDLKAVKAFYSECFGWTFTDYGDTYCAFENSGISGGFALSEDPVINGVLPVLYDEDLSGVEAVIVQNGGWISVPIFSFPGGHRFHFVGPCGNELAVWSDKYEE